VPRKPSGNKRKPQAKKPPATPASNVPVPATKYRVAVRARRVREPSNTYAADLAMDAARSGSGTLKRKNFVLDQGLLDRAREALGVETETEAVALGLTLVLEQDVIRRRMVQMVNDLGALTFLEQDPEEALDFSGFRAERSG
jgi:hypothetical protein